MLELWKKCNKYEEFAMVSNKGRVWTYGRTIEVKQSGKKTYTRYVKPIYSKIYVPENGYPQVKLSIGDGLSKTVRVHRLMMESFKPVKNMSNLEVNHIDGLKTNNNIDNLEWVTHKENMEHAIDKKLFIPEVHSAHSRLKKKVCFYCNKKYPPDNKSRKYCSKECYHKDKTTKAKPNREVLLKDIISMPMTHVGKKYGVTSNAIRKWCYNYGLPYKMKDIKELKKELNVPRFKS